MAIDLLPPPRFNVAPELEQSMRPMLAWLYALHDFLDHIDLQNRLTKLEEATESQATRLAALEDAVDAVHELGALTQTISNPPTQGEVDAIQDKVNEIIAATERQNA